MNDKQRESSTNSDFSMKLKSNYKRPEFWLLAVLLISLAMRWLKILRISPDRLVETYWPLLFVLAGIFLLTSAGYRDVGSSILLIFMGVLLFMIQTDIITWEYLQQDFPTQVLKMIYSLFDIASHTLQLTLGAKS